MKPTYSCSGILIQYEYTGFLQKIYICGRKSKLQITQQITIFEYLAEEFVFRFDNKHLSSLLYPPILRKFITTVLLIDIIYSIALTDGCLFLETLCPETLYV